MGEGAQWNRFLKRLKRYLQREVVSSFPELNTQMEFVSHLWEGKFLRSWMVYELFHKFKDRFDSNWRDAAIKVASGIEMIHLASLVHDDIMDNASVRRGKDCLYKKFGTGMAIVLGDWLFFMGQSQFSEMGAGISCAKTVVELCEGQMLEEVLKNEEDVGWTNYIRIVSKKTARLFALVVDTMFEMGIMNEEEWLRWWDWSFSWGVCYQIYDDLLDIDQDATQKKVTFVSVSLRQISPKWFSKWWQGKKTCKLPREIKEQVYTLGMDLVETLLDSEVSIKKMNVWLLEKLAQICRG